MKYLAGSLAALLAASAWAHDPLPNADWCRYGQTSVVASFDFHGGEIDAWVACVEAGQCPDPRPHNTASSDTCSSLKSCGNFDDDYGKTALRIVAYCEEYASPTEAERSVAQATGYESGTVAPIVSGPAFFLSTEHHAKYKKVTGVHGVCAKCTTLPPVKAAPDR